MGYSLSGHIGQAIETGANSIREGSGRWERSRAKTYLQQVDKVLGRSLKLQGIGMWAMTAQFLESDPGGSEVVASGKPAAGIVAVTSDLLIISHNVGWFSFYTTAYETANHSAEVVGVTLPKEQTVGLRLHSHRGDTSVIALGPISGARPAGLRAFADAVAGEFRQPPTTGAPS